MVKRTCFQGPVSWFEWKPEGEVGRYLYITHANDQPPPGEQTELLSSVMDTTLEDYPKFITNNDILYLKLYKGTLELWPAYPLMPLPDYNEVINLIKHFGPKAGGILIGNQGVELSWRHLNGDWPGNAHKNVDMIVEFIHTIGDLLIRLKAKPVFAVMDWDIIQDCYIAGGKILEALNLYNAINHIATGFTLVPGAYVRPHKYMTGKQLAWMCELEYGKWRAPLRDETFPRMREYLKAGKFTSGLGGTIGIEEGNINIMKDFGFYGFSTYLTDEDCTRLCYEYPGWWK